LNECCFKSRSEEFKVSSLVSHCGSGLRHTYGVAAILCLALRIAAFNTVNTSNPIGLSGKGG